MRTPWAARHSTRPPKPVFVDDSGRRRRRFRRAGTTGAFLSTAYLALVAIGLTGHGPLSGFQLPFVGGHAPKAHTVAVVDQPAARHEFAGAHTGGERAMAFAVARKTDVRRNTSAASAAIPRAASAAAATRVAATHPPVNSTTTTTTFVPGATNATTHGQSSTAPGQTTNGQGGNPPAHFGDTTTTLPGKAATAPGHTTTGTVQPPNGRTTTSR